MTKIYLIRHAEAEGNLYRRIHGWYDSLITQNGWRQIAELEKRFENIHIDAVYSSDLIRTQMTASAVFIQKRLPLYSSKELREVGMGIWEDMTWGDAEISYPDQLRYFTFDQDKWSVPGCERFEVLQQRILNKVKSIAEKNNEKSVAIVTHGTVIRALVAYINRVPSEEINTVTHCDNTAVSFIKYDNGDFSVEYYGDAGHLHPEQRTVSSQSWWKSKDGCDSSNMRYYTPQSNTDFEIIKKHTKVQNAEHTFIAVNRKNYVGVLSLDVDTCTNTGAGIIKEYFVFPEYRKTKFAPQLIGQAISVFRSIGCENIHVTVSDKNIEKIYFFESYGFKKVRNKDNNVELELDISYNWRKDKNIIYEQH